MSLLQSIIKAVPQPSWVNSIGVLRENAQPAVTVSVAGAAKPPVKLSAVVSARVWVEHKAMNAAVKTAMMEAIRAMKNRGERFMVLVLVFIGLRREVRFQRGEVYFLSQT